MKSKYPGNHFERLIVCFGESGFAPNGAGLRKAVRCFFEIEGYEELKCLAEEIETIDANDDWREFENSLSQRQLQCLAFAAKRLFRSEKHKRREETAEPAQEKTNRNYIGEYMEWQDHQYDPGHYTGGKLSPDYLYPGKPRNLGWIFLVQGILIILLATLVLVIVSSDVYGYIIMGAFEGAGILSILVGIRYFKKGRRKK